MKSFTFKNTLWGRVISLEWVPLQKRALILFLATLAAVAVLVQSLNLRQLRQSVARAENQKGTADAHLIRAAKAVEDARALLKQQESDWQRAQAESAAAENRLLLQNPESRWALPPRTWPEWDPASPYVWLRKELLPLFSVPAFDKDGSLTAETAAFLAVDKDARDGLNQRMKQVLAQYRELETRHAEVIPEPLPGMPQDGSAVTVQVRPLREEGERLKKAFESQLRDGLGEQRGELLLQSAKEWLDSTFGAASDLPVIISAVRDTDNTFRVSIRSGTSWISVGGTPGLASYIPAHLLPFFDALVQPDG